MKGEAGGATERPPDNINEANGSYNEGVTETQLEKAAHGFNNVKRALALAGMLGAAALLESCADHRDYQKAIDEHGSLWAENLWDAEARSSPEKMLPAMHNIIGGYDWLHKNHNPKAGRDLKPDVDLL